jgi:hypothetical protein
VLDLVAADGCGFGRRHLIPFRLCFVRLCHHYTLSVPGGNRNQGKINGIPKTAEFAYTSADLGCRPGGRFAGFLTFAGICQTDSPPTETSSAPGISPACNHFVSCCGATPSFAAA